MIPKDGDTPFCPEGTELFVLLDGKNTHCGDGTRKAFLTKSRIFAKSDFLVSIKVLNPAFLLKKAFEPNFSIWMRVSKRLEKGGQAIVIEINGTDKGRNRIERSGSARSQRTKERVRNVAGNKDTLNTEVNPCQRQIRQRDAPVLFALVQVRLEQEMVDAILLTQITFMVLPIVFEGDSRVETEEWWEKRLGPVRAPMESPEEQE